jgi:hypothetical protein
MDSISQIPNASSESKCVFPEVSKSFHLNLLSWAGQIIGKEDLSEPDLHDGFVYLQVSSTFHKVALPEHHTKIRLITKIIYAFLPSSFDISFYSSPEAQRYPDLRTRNFNILAKIFDEEFSQAIPSKVVNAAKNLESKALNEILQLLKTALETKMESVPPAAEAVGSERETSQQITKTATPDYEVADVRFIIYE